MPFPAVEAFNGCFGVEEDAILPASVLLVAMAMDCQAQRQELVTRNSCVAGIAVRRRLWWWDSWYVELQSEARTQRKCASGRLRTRSCAPGSTAQQ